MSKRIKNVTVTNLTPSSVVSKRNINYATDQAVVNQSVGVSSGSAANGTILDTLAQLPPDSPKRTKKDLSKRARQKYFSTGLVFALADYITDTPLRKSYWNTYHCANKIHQKGKKLTSRYCNNRWCMVCNRIRTGKLINGYLPQFKQMGTKYFVTLTIPNCQQQELKQTISVMIRNLVLVIRHIREKEKLKFKGIRKIECTYNSDDNNYHPHFHLIVDSHHVAESIVNGWLQRYPAAESWCQDIRESNDNSCLELFKYFTKVVSKTKKQKHYTIHVIALDTIFQAMVGKRVFQPLGIKRVSEDVDPTLSEIFDIEETDGDVWLWLKHDWVSTETGECLTNFFPSESLQNLKINI